MEWGIQFFRKLNLDSGSGTSSKNQTQFHFAVWLIGTELAVLISVGWFLPLYEEPPIPVLLKKKSVWMWFWFWFSKSDPVTIPGLTKTVSYLLVNGLVPDHFFPKFLFFSKIPVSILVSILKLGPGFDSGSRTRSSLKPVSKSSSKNQTQF